MLLQRHLQSYRRRSDRELAGIIGRVAATELAAGSGTVYQVEVEAVWDAEPGGNIRVLGTIDDGGWRALKPLSEDFIMTPSGAFVD